MEEGKFDDLEDKLAKTLDPKLVAAFKSIGSLMKTYKSGKLPKAFKLIP